MCFKGKFDSGDLNKNIDLVKNKLFIYLLGN